MVKVYLLMVIIRLVRESSVKSSCCSKHEGRYWK